MGQLLAVVSKKVRWLKKISYLALLSAVFSCKPTKEFRGAKLDTNYSSLKQGKRLAEEKCSLCHLTPHPTELEQYTWEYVLAYMGLYFGIGSENRLSFDENFLSHYRLRSALATHQKTVGIAGFLSQEEFYTLRNYYLATAEPLPPPPLPEFPNASFFVAEEFTLKAKAISLLKYHQGKLYLGDAENFALEIHELKTKKQKRLPTESPPVALKFWGKQAYVTLIGDLLGTAPNVHSAALAYLISDNELRIVAQQLIRSVGMLLTDVDGDGCTDLLNPGFGAPLQGGVYLIANFCRGERKQQLLLNRDGAVAIEPFEFLGKKGYLLAFANALEGLVFLNFENGKAHFQDLLKLPATTGLTSMKLADFSGDGQLDILLTGGDNADAGPYNTIKKAMGVRIVALEGEVLKEKYFFHYPGAFNSAIGDINLDGWMDFVVVSYFSDLRKNNPDDALLFLNQGNFQFKILRLPVEGRFTTVEIFDKDGDTLPDIVLGRAEVAYQQRIDDTIKKREFLTPRSAVIVLKNTAQFF